MIDVAPLLPELQDLYEDLHAHPELSFQEHRTSEILAARLDRLGYEVTTGVGGTGVVALLRNGDGPQVLLRADIDALPVEEATGLPYASRARGLDRDGTDVPVAHACGHDMHATWMAGVAEVLATDRAAWAGTAMIVLQPAEEIGGGAVAMIDDGLFERFGLPVVALGQHVAPGPAGWLMHRAGPVMAAADALRIVLHGRGGHGAMPEQTVDPVVMAAATVMKLQTVVSRHIGASDPAVVTVGTLHAGTRENVIADRAELGLSIRTFSPKVRARVLAQIRRIVEAEAQSAGAPKPPEIDELYSFPLLANDVEATAAVARAFTERFGRERVVEAGLVSASEDFGAYGTTGGFPSVFWFVGSTDTDTFLTALAAGRINEDIPYNHSPLFAPVPHPTIETGIQAMTAAARCWLGR